MTVVRSRDNPRVRRWRRLARSRRARRAEQAALIEGAHLLQACLDAGIAPRAVLASESGAEHAEVAALLARCASAASILADALFAEIADAAAPTGIAAEIAIPSAPLDLRGVPACAFLDGVQDAGNVGTILRSAAAFGIPAVVLGVGCADAWSPKVLRAGMGAHFQLCVEERADLPLAVTRFAGRLACTAVRDGLRPDEADLRGRIGWIFGGEGQGVSEALAQKADLKVTIPMPGGGESLNVAAAAAILFYERTRQLSTPAAPA